MKERGRTDVFSWMLTFERLLKETGFPAALREMLAVLQDAYGSPVDVEFAANFTSDERYRINLVQCRPMQVTGGGGKVSLPEVADEELVLKARGAVIGHSRVCKVDRVIYVVPSAYAALATQQQYAVARMVARLTHQDKQQDAGSTMLVGPGRWGSTTPTLGVPVTFHEISRVAVLCEVVTMRDDLVPDVSLGTHFFNDIVEADMLYVALFPDREGNLLDTAYFESAPSPSSTDTSWDQSLTGAVRLLDLPEPEMLTLVADAPAQTAICHRWRA